jgi:hypothetical protein
VPPGLEAPGRAPHRPPGALRSPRPHWDHPGEPLGGAPVTSLARKDHAQAVTQGMRPSSGQPGTTPTPQRPLGAGMLRPRRHCLWPRPHGSTRQGRALRWVVPPLPPQPESPAVRVGLGDHGVRYPCPYHQVIPSLLPVALWALLVAKWSGGLEGLLWSPQRWTRGPLLRPQPGRARDCLTVGTTRTELPQAAADRVSRLNA